MISLMYVLTHGIASSGLKSLFGWPEELKEALEKLDNLVKEENLMIAAHTLANTEHANREIQAVRRHQGVHSILYYILHVNSLLQWMKGLKNGCLHPAQVVTCRLLWRKDRKVLVIGFSNLRSLPSGKILMMRVLSCGFMAHVSHIFCQACHRINHMNNSWHWKNSYMVCIIYHKFTLLLTYGAVLVCLKSC